MSMLDQIQNDNFVWDAIAANLPGQRRRGTGKFDININCPVCVTRGERRADQFFRCGLKRNPGGIGCHCFNCGFKSRWNIGEPISQPLMSFLVELGVDDTEVKRLAHRALVIARTMGSESFTNTLAREIFEPKFDEKALPPLARPIEQWVTDGCDDPLFIRALEYLASRGMEIAADYPYYWSPDTHDMMSSRIIIPMMFRDKIVGYTARDTSDELERKYHADSPPDFLFNSRVLDDSNRRYALIVEGPFDSIAISGVGTLGAKLSDNQAAWINASGKQPVLVADRDKSGKRNIEHAIRHKWAVAFPRLASAGWWDSDVKDCAKAVELYGRLYTVKSILETMTTDPYKIEVWSKLLI